MNMSASAAPSGVDDVVAASPAMAECLRLVEELAATDVPVVFLGENGVGKSHLARRLHLASPRRSRPFLVLSCDGFGEDGVSRRFLGSGLDGRPASDGLLNMAAGGGIHFAGLDGMRVGVQKELYSFLSRYDVVKEGAPALGIRLTATIPTVPDASRRIFAEELLNVLCEAQVRVPPLRMRREDIPRLAELSAARAAAETGAGERVFSEGALDFLLHYDFPGNVSELNELVRRAVVWARGGVVEREDFGIDETGPGLGGVRLARAPVTLRDVERRHVNRVLHHAAWDVPAAARILGLAEWEVREKIAALGLRKRK